MKEYKFYNLEDFLLDDSFRDWVLHPDTASDLLWAEVRRQHPEKNVIINQARELITTWRTQNASLSEGEMEQEILRILYATETNLDPAPRKLHWGWWLSAASVLMALGILWISTAKSEKEKTYTYANYIEQSATPLRESVNTTDTTMIIHLPDHSTVELAPSSKISYSANFIKDKKREVYLSGEAFFKVQKDPQNPFFVYANGLLTRVLGTCFLVKMSGENVEVVVRTGRVSVVPITDLGNQKKRNTELLLTPNQQAIFTAKDNFLSKTIINLPVELKKVERKPNFNFENQAISEVFTTLETVYGIHFIYDSSLLKNCYLRVKLTDEAFFTKLDIICKTIGATYRVSDGQIIITSEGCQ